MICLSFSVSNAPFLPYRHAIDYFPVSVVKTADLDPGRNYLFGSHPHGVVCFGAFMSFVVDNPQFRELFPGKLITSGTTDLPMILTQSYNRYRSTRLQ